MDISFLIKVLIVAAVTIAGVSTTVIFKMKSDNVIEQVAEEVIKEQTGTTVDLSPE